MDFPAAGGLSSRDGFAGCNVADTVGGGRCVLDAVAAPPADAASRRPSRCGTTAASRCIGAATPAAGGRRNRSPSENTSAIISAISSEATIARARSPLSGGLATPAGPFFSGGGGAARNPLSGSVKICEIGAESPWLGSRRTDDSILLSLLLLFLVSLPTFPAPFAALGFLKQWKTKVYDIDCVVVII